MARVTLTAGSDADPGTGVNTGADSIPGLGGHDTIAAGLGADMVQGGAGRDVITDIVSEGAQASLINGGNDDDRITVTGTGGQVEVHGGQGNAWFILSGTDFLVDGSTESDEVDTLELTAPIIKGVGSSETFYRDIDGRKGNVSGIDLLILHGTAEADLLSMGQGVRTGDAAFRIDGGGGR